MEIQIGMHCKLFMDETEYIIEGIKQKEVNSTTPEGDEVIHLEKLFKLRDYKNPNIIREEVSVIHITQTYYE